MNMQWIFLNKYLEKNSFSHSSYFILPELYIVTELTSMC